ncbi:hypothetical protein VPH35_122480 [Triticum aestivum]
MVVLLVASHGMFIPRSSRVPLFEAVVSYCRLPFHSYVREVAYDGSLLGGVEIDVLVSEDVVRCQTHFSGAAAYKAVRFLQGVYGFVIADYNYDSMLAYKGAALSSGASVSGRYMLASTLARSTWPLVHSGGQRNTAGVNASVQLQLLYSQLVGSVGEF